MATHPTTPDDEYLLWLDFETDGLDTSTCRPFEYAAQVTAFDAPDDVLASLGVVIGSWVDGHVPHLDPWIRGAHGASGLLDAMGHGVSEAMARLYLDEFIQDQADLRGRMVLAGSGVHFDRRLVDHRWGPDVLGQPRMHYRILDVTVLRLTARSMGLPLYERSRPHRADEDLADTRREFGYYQRMMAAGVTGGGDA
jgi:oligoribonuclease (3'-5' exoribonuclease)